MDVTLDIGKLIGEVQERVRSLKRLNIMVVGKTGVGKSTLINTVFRDRLAETGIGKPVTEHIRQYSKPEIPLTIYDTKGFELDQKVQNEVSDEIFNIIDQGAHSGDINNAIHCIWYCISTVSNRIEQSEINWIKNITEKNKIAKVPIIVVLTKSYSKMDADKMRRYIDTLNLNVVQVIPILTEDYIINDEYTAKAYNLDKLVEVMANVLPEEIIESFHNVQIVNMELKRKRAQVVVASAATATAAEGASPIPFSDAFLMIPTQILMIASITAIYGIEVQSGLVLTLLTSVLGTGSVTVAGKAIVTGLLKLIPGAGSIVGGTISASTGAALTTALGEAYIKVAEAVATGRMRKEELRTKEGRKKIKEIVENKGIE